MNTDIGVLLQNMDDARADYKRMQRFDKQSRGLTATGLATGAGGIAGAALINDGLGFLLLIAIVSIGLGIFLWVHVHWTDRSYSGAKTSRLQDARTALRRAESAYQAAAVA